MDRRAFLMGSLSFIVAPLAAEAQQKAMPGSGPQHRVARVY